MFSDIAMKLGTGECPEDLGTLEVHRDLNLIILSTDILVRTLREQPLSNTLGGWVKDVFV